MANKQEIIEFLTQKGIETQGLLWPELQKVYASNKTKPDTDTDTAANQPVFNPDYGLKTQLTALIDDVNKNGKPREKQALIFLKKAILFLG
jgi:hypothetical protein